MNSRVSALFAKINKNRQLGVSKLASKAVKIGIETANAQFLLRDVSSLGGNPRVSGRVNVDNRGRIEIGRNLAVFAHWIPLELRSEEGGTLSIGSDVVFNYGTLVAAKQQVTIGDRVMMGQLCVIADTDVPGHDGMASSIPRTPGPIEIGEGSWLAARVTVLPGSTIGAGSVITAGSVVSGVIPPGVIAGGMPARVLRKLGDESKEAAAETPTPGVAAAPAPKAPVKPEVKYSGQVLADFTADELAHLFDEDLEGPGVALDVAPFGQVVQQLMMGPSPDNKDFALVWTRPETSLPSFAKLLAFETVTEEALLADVDAFCETLLKGIGQWRFGFVPTWTAPAWNRGSGLIDGRQGGIARALAACNLRLMQKLEKNPNVFVLDSSKWVTTGGKNANSPKLWLMGKVAFSTDVLKECVRDIKAALRALSGGMRKLLVLDLDDTMWGGIVGDQGWQNLRLGGHDSLGESFVEFQRAVKAITKRGVVLAIVSKNEESVALEAIASHPEMQLRKDDFVAWRINWKDKAQNIAEIANELNLGLQSVVFLDDNPVERARVREALPEVLVPEWPEDKLLYKQAFQSLRCFDTPAITKEDQERTAQYTQERRREESQAKVGNIEEWLKSLEIKVKAEPLSASNIQRTVQLLNKTNQLNLTTRRLSEAEMSEWLKASNRALWAISVSDRFGDAGLTGIVSIEVDGAEAKIVDYVLSCRVMGRKVENTLVHVAVEAARARGAKKVKATLLPTAKNKPTLTFFSNESGLEKPADNLFVWDASKPYALPEAITLEKLG